jgi:hypothetical protein
MSSTGDRILKKFSERMADYATETRCGRVDLKMTDYEMMSPDEATILLQYNRGSGVPKRTQVAEWVTASWNGSLRVAGESILHYPDQQLITAQIRSTSLKMPMDERFLGRMMRVGSDYIDADQAIWEVREGDGGKYLVRKTADNVEALLEERINAMKLGSTHHLPRLAHIVTAGISDPTVGDHVEFLDTKDGMSRKFGKVTKVTGDKVTVSAKGESVTTDRSNLIAVTKQSPQSDKERKKMEEDFYAEYFFSGDRALARKLVR